MRAREEWEAGARAFMTATLDAARAAHPRGKFGFFAYPTCYGALYEWLPVPELGLTGIQAQPQLMGLATIFGARDRYSR